jgi:hypothetical protein
MATRGRTGPQFPGPRVQQGVHEGLLSVQSHLMARHLRRDPETGEYKEIGRREATRCVTDAFVAFVVDQLQTETSEFGDFKFHDSGTGTNAENATDTALQTPCGEARDTGSQEEGATANIYKTIATHTYAGTFAITEHGVFSQATGATLMDRSVFSAINVESSDQIQFTYQLTLTSGS